MIVFEKILYKNFVSSGNIPIELDLNTHGTTLMSGTNGAGKSTFLDAISFALFGKAFRNVNKPQLINSINQKNMVVELDFSIAKNKYKIIRGMKPNIFEVYKDGTLLNQSADNRDYQDVLERTIIKVNHKSFCQVVMLGSATYQPFMALPLAHRRSIIEDLLDLQIFTTMNLLLKDDMNTNDFDVVECNNEIKLTEEKIKITKEHLIELQNTNESFIEEKKKIIDDTLEQITVNEVKIEEYRKKIKDLKSQTENHSSLQKKLTKLSSLRHKIEANLSLLHKDLDFFNDHDECPTCKQSIDQGFKCETVDQKNKEITEINDGLIQLGEQYQELENQINTILEINSEINSLKMDESRILTQSESLNRYINNLKNEIKNIKKTIKEQDYEKTIELEEQLVQHLTKYNELIEDKQVNGAASAILKDSGIKAKIIRQYVPVINKLINKYLSSMEFMCQFELDEEFKETIKSRFRDEFTYASFSEGEKMRINLAILFTWRAVAKLRNSVSTNILILDEILDSSLDVNGTEEFLKIINNLTTDTNTFIISHKTDQLIDKFDRVVRFEKIKSFSRLAH